MDRILWSPTKGRIQTPADNIAVLTTFAVFAGLKANQFKILVHTLALIQKLTIKQAQCITLNRKQASAAKMAATTVGSGHVLHKRYTNKKATKKRKIGTHVCCIVEGS
jgi:hypothetical protein